MRYDYKCNSCEGEWEEDQFLNDRNIPTLLPCIKCGKSNMVTRKISNSRISYGGSKSNLARAGSGWNDLLTGIKKASGKNAEHINVR